MCRWIEWNFHDRIEYNAVAFSTELLEWGCNFAEFGGKKILGKKGFENGKFAVRMSLPARTTKSD